jgi:hypothetical protein
MYTGGHSVSFISMGLEVGPDEEFDVSDELAESFLRRDDVWEVSISTPKAKKKSAENPVDEAVELPTEVHEETSDESTSDQGTGTDTTEV